MDVVHDSAPNVQQVPGAQSENLEHTSSHQMSVDSHDIVKSNEPGGSELNGAPKLSSKERRAENRRQKLKKEKYLRRRNFKRKMIEVQGFEHDVSSTLSVHKVPGKYSQMARTRPSLVENSMNTHESTVLPSSESPVSTTNEGIRVTVDDLHPDCDEEVKKRVGENWTYISNDIHCAQVVVDESDRIIVTKARQPRGHEQFELQQRNAFDCMVDVRSSVLPLESGLEVSRQCDPDACPRLFAGVSCGSGQTLQPKGGPNKFERIALDKLFENIYIRKMINLTSVDFRTRYPEMSVLYDQLQIRMGITGASQERFDIFQSSPFCNTTFNLGPKATTRIHQECGHHIGGLCAIIVLGNFNHQTSGHLILHEIRTIMEIRPGDVVFVPSAGISYSDSSLKEHEERCTIVQYTTGELFRKVWSESEGEKDDSIDTDTDILRKRWEESLEILGSVSDKRSRIERAQWMENHITQGHSTLLPRAPSH